METTTETALDSLLSSPILSALISTVPALASTAADARRELASAREETEETRAALAQAIANANASSGNHAEPAPSGPAPIIRAQWKPQTITTDTHYSMPDGMLATIRAAMATGAPVMLIGPRGTGKTEAIQHAAAAENRPLFILDCGPVRDASEWFGSATLSRGRVAWQDSQLVAALATPRAVIMLDELNRAATEAQNALLPLMDSRRAIQFPQRSEPVRMAEGVTFAATANVGAEYVGTGGIDAALADRCVYVETEYLPPDRECDMLRARFPNAPAPIVEALTELAASTRTETYRDATGGAAISTRALIQALRMYQALAPITTADEARALTVRALLAPMDNIGAASPRATCAATAAKLRLT
jgi:MoxR-like ATPase